MIALNSLTGRRGILVVTLRSLALRQIGQLSISAALGELGALVPYFCMSLTWCECMRPVAVGAKSCEGLTGTNDAKGLTGQMVAL